MQVLERVISLKEGEYKNLLEKEFPIEFLGIDVNEVRLVRTSENQIEELKHILNRLCYNQHDDRIKSITPIGWLLLLCWISEIDRQENYVTKPGIKRKAEKDILNELRDDLSKLASNLMTADDDTEEKKAAFPFDNVNKFINIWNEGAVSQAYNLLNRIDLLDNIKIDKKVSAYFNYKNLSNNKIEINVPDKGLYTLPLFFLTDGMIGNGGKRSIADKITGESIWSQTTLNNDVVGISVISDKLMMLSGLDRRGNISVLNQSNDEDNNGYILNLSNIDENKEIIEDNESRNTNQEKCENTEIEDNEDKKEAFIEIEEKDNDLNCNGVFNNSDYDEFKEIIKKIEQFQTQSWTKRSKQFHNYDRIAFFQFEVDNSYEHPIRELCDNEKDLEINTLKYKSSKSSWDPYKARKKSDPEDNNFLFYSCAELRRQELLRKVLETCRKFDVEILLLPEYSVRPETVVWLGKYIKESGHKISIWAGTLRLVPNRNLLGTTLEEFKLEDYDWAALLPIVTYNTDEFYATSSTSNKATEPIEIKVVGRVKKYPAVSLQEVINPFMARRANAKSKFDAVIKNKFDEKLFGDARDHIFELICAELFMISSPSNISMLAKASFDLYKKFNGKRTTINFEDYYREGVEDIISFGERTSVHQKNFKYGRTPILLIPAYTTRAVDYYVTAQSGYLASGLTSVFCNAVDIESTGGSCFIGTDSWDNRNGGKEESLPNYSPYHGLTPGIYQQFLQEKDRGALAKNEQALVICDINPSISFKGKPNPQTLGSTLELVAHLPIIESHILDIKKKEKKAPDYKYYCRCQKYKRRQIINKYCMCCEEFDICHKCDTAMRYILEMGDYLERKDNKGYKTTIDDENPKIIGESLKHIGKGIGSDWLSRRGDVYIKQHINDPQSWPPPTALDWIWVDIDYGDNDKKEHAKIDIPKFASVEMK